MNRVFLLRMKSRTKNCRGLSQILELLSKCGINVAIYTTLNGKYA